MYALVKFQISAPVATTIILVTLIHGITAQCPDPGVPDNGYLVSPINPSYPVPTQTELKFRCSEGYTMYGKSSLLCSDDGSWDSQLPLCTGLRNVALLGLTAEVNGEKYNWVKTKSPLNENPYGVLVTSNSTAPYWKLDLGGVHDVEYVVVYYGWRNGARFKLVGAVVRAGMDEELTENSQCGSMVGESDLTSRSDSIIFSCNSPIRARYVSIQRENVTGEDVLIVWNVEVLATGVCEFDPGIPENGYRVSGDPILPAIEGNVSQYLEYACQEGYTRYGDAVVRCIGGSTWSFLPICTEFEDVALSKYAETRTLNSNSNVTTFGNDGDVATYFKTTHDPQASWVVDLGGLYEVQYVYVINRESDQTCQKCGQRWFFLYIAVGMHFDDTRANWKCGEKINDKTKILSEATMRCSRPILARYVAARIGGVAGILNLAEIKVFGKAMCEDPGPLDHGSYMDPSSGQTVSFPVYSEQIIQVACLPGYTLIGNDTLECTTEARWNASRPVCVQDQSSTEATFGNYEATTGATSTQNLGLDTDLQPVITSDGTNAATSFPTTTIYRSRTTESVDVVTSTVASSAETLNYSEDSTTINFSRASKNLLSTPNKPGLNHIVMAVSLVCVFISAIGAAVAIRIAKSNYAKYVDRKRIETNAKYLKQESKVDCVASEFMEKPRNLAWQ
ncbi:CUB and sushi domain-containing protein 3-like isoform X2 [Ptychodera flava]|uniref:CUB and sushi domain-containing protein 3-like isoform X2 n=1 Tax=Ptychodera flava TaxID=63121 RepID=UPI003969C90B